MRFVNRRRQKNYLWLQLSRPGRGNAIGTTIAAELELSMRELKRDLAPWQKKPSDYAKLPYRALVFSAQTTKTKRQSIWIAGGDLYELSELQSRREGLAYAQVLHKICRELETLPIPVIMLIDGLAVGGGAELALAGDIRLGTKDAGFEFRQLRLGLTTGYGGTRRLVELVGRAKAQAYLYLSERIDATQAVATGLLHRMVPNAQQLFLALDAYTDQVENIDPWVLACQKHLLRLGDEMPPASADKVELQLFGDLWMNPQHKREVQRFVRREKAAKTQA